MDYVIYDVFTGTPLAGNPLAVVFDAEGLDTARMQAIASEFNLSETAFVSAPEGKGHSARVRIFTPGRELPFAGHPTVGTAIALAERKIAAAMPARGIDLVEVLEENIGPVRCAVRLLPGEPGFAEFDLPRRSEKMALALEAADAAAALGIGRHEVGFENHVPSVWSAGVPFAFVPVRDLSVAAKVACNVAVWREVAPVHDGKMTSIYVYCRGGEHHNAAFHARMFGAGMGISEDPATGGAAAAFSGAIHAFDGLPDGHHALMIEQGLEMGRPSHIHLHIDCAGGEITHGRIGGQAVKVAEGRLLV